MEYFIESAHACYLCTSLNQYKEKKLVIVISNRTHAASDFEVTHNYDLRPNCTPLSSITIINQVKHYLWHTCVDYLFRQIYQNLVNFSLLDVWFSALYWSWKDLNQDRKKSSYPWSLKKSTVA